MNFKTKTAAAGILAVLTVAAAAFVILPRHKKLPAPAAVQADKVLVKKAERKLYLQKDGQNLKEYRIALGFAPVGDKLREGDGKTPEGIYCISGRNPNSRFYLSLRVSYPSAEDRREAAEKGFSPGGDIMIHGLPNKAPFLGSAHLLRDWTAGCIAVTNEEIEEIWSMVADGTTIEILP